MLASWLYLNAVGGKTAMALTAGRLVSMLDGMGVLDLAATKALPDSVPVPTSHAEANACFAHYRALDAGSRITMQHRLVATSEQLGALASLYRDAHNQWAADERAAARQRMGLPSVEGGDA
jgi:hypothetical protein